MSAAFPPPRAWPDTDFQALLAAAIHDERPTGVFLDVCSVCCLCSELTWYPEEAERKLPVEDRVQRPQQLEHERQQPGMMRKFLANLLSSGLRLFVSEEVADDSDRLLTTVGGVREQTRWTELRSQNRLYIIKDGLTDDLPPIQGELSAHLWPIPPDCVKDWDRIMLGDVELIDRWRRLETGEATDEDFLLEKKKEEERESELKTSGVSTIPPNLDSVDTDSLSDLDDDVNILIQDKSFQDLLTESRRAQTEQPCRSSSKRRKVTLYGLEESIMQPNEEQAVRIGERKAARSAKRAEQRRALLMQMRTNLHSLITVTRRVNERNIRTLAAAIENNLVLVTGDRGLVKALKEQRLDLEKLGLVIVHPTRSLAGQ